MQSQSLNGMLPERENAQLSRTVTNSTASAEEPRNIQAPSASRKSSWIPVYLDPSLVLENSGSVARDHLASERTFLAYLRTSLAISSMGVALVQLFTIATTGKVSDQEPSLSITSLHVYGFAKPLGATTIIFGLVVLAIGVIRYFTVQQALTEGKFPAARVVITGITVVLSALIVVVFAILVSAKR